MSTSNSTLEAPILDTEQLELAEKAAMGVVSIARVLQINLTAQDSKEGEPFCNFIAGGLLDALEVLGWEQDSILSRMIKEGEK